MNRVNKLIYRRSFKIEFITEAGVKIWKFDDACIENNWVLRLKKNGFGEMIEQWIILLVRQQVS